MGGLGESSHDLSLSQKCNYIIYPQRHKNTKRGSILPYIQSLRDSWEELKSSPDSFLIKEIVGSLCYLSGRYLGLETQESILK